ncbi:hypothetical protein MSAN_01727900 [Mycena sanguinolenta]|uniref:DUF6534 domain-containing protein n=1 Tax=Mycena sanguinolenta TaxID=230812 RepID=A0A8H6XZF6_9AGAR|nr:hypothetical protein MSAN_01727900 [Mycena sanguinolenta]
MADFGKFTIPLFVGTVMNWALLGTLTVQIYIYYLAFPNDRRSSKFVVAFVVLAEFLQTLSNSRDTFHILGSGWGNPQVLNDVGLAWFSVPVLGSLIASVGQIFFAWRIYIIAKSLYVPILITQVTAVQLAAGIWTGIDVIHAKEWSEFPVLKPPEVWLSATAASDLMIVTSMVFYLRKAQQPEFRRKTNFTATLSRIIKVSTHSQIVNDIHTFVEITVETGVLCAVCAIIDLYLFIAFDGNSYHLGVCIWLSKVYSNSILLILNSRAHIGHEIVSPGNIGMSQITEVVFLSAQDSASAIEVSLDMQASNMNGEVLENDGHLDEIHLEKIV